MEAATVPTDLVASLKTKLEDAPTVTVTRNRYGYEIDGRYMRRVTTLCGGIPKPWLGSWAAKMVAEFAIENKEAWESLNKTDALKLLKGAPWSKRDDAGDRGQAVHTTLEAIVRGQPIPDGLTDDELACARSAEALLNERGSQILASELIVYNPTHGYAGTLDLWELDADGVPWILDYKTSSGVYTEHAIQQVAYQHAEFAVVNKTRAVGKGATEKWTGKVIPWGPEMAARLGIVHVRPDGATLHPILETDRLWTAFRAAAHVKLFQLDTDSSFGKTPRLEVFGAPMMDITTTEEEAA